ncbi:MAG: D-alanyl-D-alanine carboxypeptidase/D-alanyl-D-alanine-endopeptidase [Phycisphaerales bacterium]|nr:D-alanyl-D-alanine carboxypeptidase/D-alanyl-D-alanine-endopeptidase [Phycisphaerales bacterium]
MPFDAALRPRRPIRPTIRPARTLAAGLGVLISLGSAFLSTTAEAGIREDIETIIRTAEVGGAVVGVSVRDCDTNQELAGFRADDQFIPASNMKLITTGAALHVLGPDFSYRTQLLRNKDRLIVLGDGDPAFGDPELLELMPSSSAPNAPAMDIETFIRLWIDPVVQSGLNPIREIVVDDRIFDREFVPETWPRDQLNRRYCAEVAGLTFHLNVMHYFPRPTGETRADFSIRSPQAHWLAEENHASARTGPGDKSNVWIARAADGNKFVFYGNVKNAYRAPVPVTLHDTPEFFAHLLADRLESRGRTVGSFRVADANDPPSMGVPVGHIISTPIATVITRCNSDSQNLYAECLIKRIGHELTGEAGSWTNGCAMVRHIVHQRLNSPALLATLNVTDGSGLSRENRVSPALLTTWLYSFHQDERLGATFIGSLAVAGETGTLRKRFGNVNQYGMTVQAKSGYIDGVSCLTGYVTSPDNRRLAFSVLVNDLPPGTVAKAKRLQEKIVSRVAQHLAAEQVTLGSD